MENEIIINLSKTRLWFTTVGCFAFVLTGVFLLKTVPSLYQIVFSENDLSAIIKILIGILCIAFFGLGAIIGIVKLLGNNPGIIINHLGIDIIGVYLIRWDDIIDYSTAKERGINIFLLYVQNPEEYIAAATGLKKIKMRISMDDYKTPFGISPNPYQCSFDELKNAILEGMKNHALSKRGK